jgi:hypothetical protein
MRMLEMEPPAEPGRLLPNGLRAAENYAEGGSIASRFNLNAKYSALPGHRL